MPVLKSPGYEKLAQELAKNKSYSDAGKSAGYTGDRASICEMLANNPNISKRIEELQQTAAEKAGVDMEWWVRETKGLYKKCVKESELPTARGSLDMLGKHLGAYNADESDRKKDEKVEINIGVDE